MSMNKRMDKQTIVYSFIPQNLVLKKDKVMTYKDINEFHRKYVR